MGFAEQRFCGVAHAAREGPPGALRQPITRNVRNVGASLCMLTYQADVFMLQQASSNQACRSGRTACMSGGTVPQTTAAYTAAAAAQR